MAESTEKTVRQKLVAAIQGIAQAQLGFEGPKGNVHEYPLEFHQDERPTTFLMARVAGKQEPRAWAVDVAAYEEWSTTQNGLVRTYLIRVIGYYQDDGIDGEKYLLLRDHASKVRGAITALDSNLGGVVSTVTRATPLVVKKVNGVKGFKLLVGEMAYTALKINPDF